MPQDQQTEDQDHFSEVQPIFDIQWLLKAL